MQIGSGMQGNGSADILPRPTDVYWASLPPEELGPQVASRYREWIRELHMRGWLQLVWKCESTYYGYDPQTGAVSDNVLPSGEEGETLAVHVNQFRAFVKHQKVLATADRVHVQAVASNDDPDSMVQATLGTQIARWYLERGGLEKLAKEALERALVCGGGYITQLWDIFDGPEVGVEPARMTEGGTELPERVVRGGDVRHSVHGPEDVARDIGLRSHEAMKWCVVRERHDKWELAARFPDHREHILAQPRFDRDDTSMWELGTNSLTLVGDTDQIHVLRLLHARCDALPHGREALVVGGQVIMHADDLPYAKLPVIPIIPEEIFDMAMGYSSNWDLLSPQQAYNAAADAALSWQDAGSVLTWTAPRAANVNAQDIGSSRLLEYTPVPGVDGGGKPTLLQVSAPNESTFKMVEMWSQIMGQLSGINAVTRGESEGSSGADNALLQAQAVQFNSPNGTKYAETIEALCMGVIELLRTFASGERVLQVVGEDEQPLLARFESQDLEHITAISVEVGNPIMRTMQGRKALADQLLETWGETVDRQEWLTFLSTGRLEPMYKAERNEVILIRSENAKMSRGEMVPVLLADNHMCHIREHLGLLSTPAARTNKPLADIVMGHIQAHQMAWSEVAMRYPSILAATNQPPPPPPAGGAMGPPGPPPGPDAGPPPPEPGGGPPGEGMAERAAVAGVSEDDVGAALPSMPKNPMTGESAVVPGGGGM